LKGAKERGNAEASDRPGATLITAVGSLNRHQFFPFLTPETLAALRNAGARETTLVYGAIVDDVACGAAAVQFSAADGDPLPVADILSLYVVEAYRRRGAGKALLDRLVAAARGRGARDVLTAFDLDGERAGIMRGLLAGRGFTENERAARPVYAAALSAVAAGKLFGGRDGASERPADVLPFADLPTHMVRAFNKKQSKNAAFFFGDIHPGRIERDLSHACVRAGEILGGLWVSVCGENALSVDGLYLERADSGFLPSLLRVCLRAALAKYPPHTELRIAAAGDTTELLLDRLLGDVPFARSGVAVMRLLL
jgi:GNAT superfamily N-acetyltransferase